MSTRVYIGRLADSARDRDVERFFKGYGRIKEILLKNGYGFVEFEDARDADDAVYDLNGKMLCGERIIVEHAKSPGSRTAAQFERRNTDRSGPPVHTQFRVVVDNLSSRTSWQDLKDFFSKVSEVTYADAHKDRSGEGVAEFATLGDMKNAITKLNGTELSGRKIRIREDRGGSSRRRSRSRSHSRSRRRSGSRSARRRSRSRSRSRTPRRSRSNSRRVSPRRSASHSARRSARNDSRTPPRKKSRSASRDSRSPRRSPSQHRNGDSRSRSPVRNGRDRRRSSSEN